MAVLLNKYFAPSFACTSTVFDVLMFFYTIDHDVITEISMKESEAGL